MYIFYTILVMRNNVGVLFEYTMKLPRASGSLYDNKKELVTEETNELV